MTNAADHVYQTSDVIGTGNATLVAVSGFRTFDSAFPASSNSNRFFYSIRHIVTGEYETGEGYIDTGALVRAAVISSSNANALVNFTAGAKEVVCDVPASIQQAIEAAAPINAGATAGTSTAYTATATGIFALSDGLSISVVMHLASGTSPTLNLNGLGAKAIRYGSTSTPPSGYLRINTRLTLVYQQTLDTWNVSGGAMGTAGAYNTSTSGTAVPLLSGANTWGAKQTFFTATTSAASINIPHGTAPTTPTNGDAWGTTSGLFYRQNGTTVQLADKTNAQTFASTVTATGFTSSGTDPRYTLTETDAGVDSKNWDHVAIGGSYYFRLLNDAYSASSTILSVTRSATTIGAIYFYGASLGVQHTNPRSIWWETDGAVDAKIWDVSVDGGSMYWRLINDAQASATTFLTVTRSGTSVSAFTFGANIALPYGSAAAPSLTFGDSTTGWFRSATNQLSYSISGTQMFYASASAATFNHSVRVADGGGTVSAPHFAYGSDTNTGLRRVSEDVQAVVCGGSDVLTIGGSDVWALFAASTTARAAVRFGQGVDPTSPQDGDMWRTSSGLFFRYGGTTYQLNGVRGTWTPTGNGVTYANPLGRYVKIDRLCFIDYEFQFPTTSDTSQVKISGLPFAPSTGLGNISGTGTLGYYNHAGSDTPAQIVWAGSNIVWYSRSGATYTNANASGLYVRGTAVYETAS